MKPIVPAAMLALAATLLAAPSIAQDYPTKAVRIVVTFTPGGSSDVTARALAIPLQKHLGQPVVVDNKPGAGGTIAASEIVRASPDGYNLLMSNTTPISLAPFMLDPQPYDSIKGFTHVSLVATVPDVVMVHPSVPAKTMAELAHLDQSAEQEGVLRLGRRRLDRPYPRRDLQEGDRPQHRARRLQGQRADDHRPDRRPDELLVRHAAAERAAYQSREAQAAGGDVAGALACGAGHPDRDRGGLSGAGVGELHRRVGAGRAAGSRCGRSCTGRSRPRSTIRRLSRA